MRRLTGLVLVVALGAMAYSVMKNPEKRASVMGTLEQSTGVNLSPQTRDAVAEAAGAAGTAAEQLFRELGDTLTDPRLYESLREWGADALDRLDDVELEQLKRDLEFESVGSSVNYDEILERYLGGHAADS